MATKKTKKTTKLLRKVKKLEPTKSLDIPITSTKRAY